jgi:hypothetical protein
LDNLISIPYFIDILKTNAIRRKVFIISRVEQECTRDYSLCQTRRCGKSKPFLDSSPDVSSFHESSGMSENIIKIIFSDIILYDL